MILCDLISHSCKGISISLIVVLKVYTVGLVDFLEYQFFLGVALASDKLLQGCRWNLYDRSTFTTIELILDIAGQVGDVKYLPGGPEGITFNENDRPFIYIQHDLLGNIIYPIKPLCK